MWPFENTEDAAQRPALRRASLFARLYGAMMAHQLPIAGVVEAVIDGVRDGCNIAWRRGTTIGIMSRTWRGGMLYRS